MSRFSLFGSIVCGALLLNACDSSDQTSDLSTPSLSASELALPLPDRIRSLSALDPGDIIASAIVNGVPVALQADNNGGYRGSVQVPARSTVDVEIEFSEQFADQSLVLATRSQRLTTGSANQSLNLRRAGYDFNSHDADGDSVSNITEREEDTDPFVATDAPPMINVTMIASRPLALISSDFNEFFFEGTVGRDAQVLTQSGSVFRGDFYTVDRAPVEASVAMVETVTDQQFEVATQSRQLTELFIQQIILFESTTYDVHDQDNDGLSDIEELIAGTDITTDNNTPSTNDVTLTTNFTVPAAIENALSVYAEYRIDGQLVSPVRNENSYSAATNVSKNSTVLLNVSILDNYNNQAYVLANAQQTVAIGSANQTVVFAASDFVLEQDTDGDGVLNYIERAQGTDPFNPPDIDPPVSCTVSPLPVTAGPAGERVTVEDISSYINCQNTEYALNAPSFGFVWSSPADSISWQVPAESIVGNTIGYTLEVTNPGDASEVYVTALVQTRVQAAVCNQTTELQIGASKDLFFQNSRVFNNEELRVNSSNRTALIGFDIPQQAGELSVAQLVLTVEDDSGNGTIEVYQDDSYQWDESDNDLELPALTDLVGSRDGAWLAGTTYKIQLTSVFVNIESDSLNLFLQQASGGNDADFTSSETSTPPVLELVYNNCN